MSGKKLGIEKNSSPADDDKQDPEKDVYNKTSDPTFKLSMTPSGTKKTSVITPEVCVVADRNKLSHRAVTELFGASIIGELLN